MAERRRDRAAGDARSAAARARVAQAEATLESARPSQGDTLLVAPIAGRITRFDIEPGDHVRPGAAVAAVVGHARWVEANFEQDQLGFIRRGQRVEVTIDAYGGDSELPATVESVQAGTGSEPGV